MAKTGTERCEDTLRYVHSKVDSELAQHLRQLIATSASSLVDSVTEDELGDEVSLKGAKTWYYTRDKETRRALRALLLCQSVYFSKMWCETAFLLGGEGIGESTTQMAKVDLRPQNMKRTSIEHWRTRNEADVQRALKTFIVTENSHATALATAATEQGNVTASLPDLRLTRETRPFPGHKTCYSAVIYWLFKAGFVSYRWMMRNKDAKPDQLPDVFGPGTTVWAPDRTFGSADHLPRIPKGHVVHMYDTLAGPHGYAGHFLVSNGDGNAYGCNNDDHIDTGKSRNYDLCRLDKQFLAYKGTVDLQDVRAHGKTTEKSAKSRAQKGLLETFDPTQIPNRY